MKNGKKWGLLFLVLALLTGCAVILQSKSFSFSQFQHTLWSSSPGWMIAAIAAMLGFILFEGMSLLCIIKAFGYRKSFCKGFLYSSADVYFSAITPSATGGQPASGYFMMKDGIPGAVVTITLVANLIMYTLALLTVGITGFVIKPEIFLHFHLPGRILIICGCMVLSGLTVAFFLMILKPRILEKICEFFLKLGRKLHLVRHEEEKRQKLYRTMEEYRQCANAMADHKMVFVKAYIFNLLQRLSQITVTLFVYLAIGGSTSLAADIWFTQSYVTLGTYSVPIPGGMGVADYLLIEGFGAFFEEAEAVNLELISRGMSFYICILISAITVFLGTIITVKKRKSK